MSLEADGAWGAKAIRVAPLQMEATTVDGTIHRAAAINEVSLLRETRQTAKIDYKSGFAPQAKK